MKTRQLFVVKLLFCSLILFVIWNPVTDAYVAALNHLMRSIIGIDNSVGKGIGKLIREMFVYLIPLISLVLLTPRVGMQRRICILVPGTLVFMLPDILLVKHVYSSGGLINPNNSVFLSIYHSFKLVFPFLFWIMLCYPYISIPHHMKGAAK